MDDDETARILTKQEVKQESPSGSGGTKLDMKDVKLSIPKVIVCQETLASIQKICQQLKPCSFEEKIRFKLDDLYDGNLQLLQAIPLDSVCAAAASCETSDQSLLHLIDHPKTQIDVKTPEDKIGIMQSNNIPIKEMVHHLRCDHIHPNTEIENAYVTLYDEFKYNLLKTSMDKELKPVIDGLANAKQICWLSNHQLEWILHLKAPLDALIFFERHCDYIAQSVRNHGQNHKPTLEKVKESIKKNKKTINNCSYLTPISNVMFSGCTTSIQCHSRLMTAVEESRLEFNDRMVKYYSDAQGVTPNSLGLTLAILEVKLLLAIRIYESKKLLREMSHSPREAEVKMELELRRECKEITDAIEKKKECLASDVKTRHQEAERRESFGVTNWTKKVESARDTVQKLEVDLDEKKASRKPGDTSAQTAPVTPKKSCKSPNRPEEKASRSTDPQSSSSSKCSNVSDTRKKEMRLTRADREYFEPKTTYEYNQRMKELEKEIEQIKLQCTTTEQEKINLERQKQEIKDKQMQELRKNQRRKFGRKTSSSEDEIDLTGDDDDNLGVQIAVHESLKSVNESSRRRKSQVQSSDVITLD